MASLPTARTFRLPECTTQEDLECRWNVVLQFGDKVLLAGYYYNGTGAEWFGAVYRYSGKGCHCDDPIELRNVSQQFFEDEGHAIAWAMGRC